MKPKRLPRLWCALQGLLPLDACEAAQRAELAWPREELVGGGKTAGQLAADASGKFPRPEVRGFRR